MVTRLLVALLGLALASALVVMLGFAGAYQDLAPEIPDAAALRNVKTQVPLRVFSRDGKLIAQIGEQRRIPLAWQQIPAVVVNAFLAAEDDRFFQHPGVDWQGLVRAGAHRLLRASCKSPSRVFSDGSSTTSWSSSRSTRPR